MTDTVSLMDGLYTFKLPKLPDEKEIWYYDLPKKEQYFKTPFAKNFKWLNTKEKWGIRNVNQMSEKERVEYITYWREKSDDGLWFMNGGVPTYMTGAHVDHLIFNRHKPDPYIYLEAQKERFYFRQLTNEEPLCDGRCWVKGRRLGITEEEVTEGVRVINADFGNHIACQSDTETKAKISILTKMINVHTKRVPWMREVFYASNGKIPRAALELIENTVRDDENYPLGGTARAFPSTPKAIDGLEFMLVIMDELSKWAGVSPRETYEINIKTIVNPGKRGKLDALSTTGDSEEARKAVKDWHQLIADSNPKVLNANGKTNSGLWYYFVSYIHSFELMEKFQQMELQPSSKWRLSDLLDKYGKVNREVAEEYIWNEVRNHPKDSKGYVYALYKMPMELRHALLTPTGQGYFSKLRITNRLDILRALPWDRKPYIVGSLEENPDGTVYFESNFEREIRCEREKITYVAGKWKIALHPYFSEENKIDTRNRYRKVGGVYFPVINPEGGIGYDPIRYNKDDTSSTSLSDACIIVYKKHDYFKSGEFNQYCGLYLDRPDDPSEANHECIKAAKYWGYPVMHERVIETVKTDFDKANMLPFLMKDPKNDLYGLWIDSQGKVVKNAIDMMVRRFNAPLQNPEDTDYYASHPFEDTLVDMDMFDIANTTAFDCFMAMVELEHGLSQITYTNLTEQVTNSMADIIHQIVPMVR